MIKEYRGVQYIVYWRDMLGHFNGYVRIPDNHPYNKKVRKIRLFNFKYTLESLKFDREMRIPPSDDFRALKGFSKVFLAFFNWNNWHKLYNGYDDLNIDCHGGLTFSRRVKKSDQKIFPQGFSVGAWIGWDYAQYGDKINYPPEIKKILEKTDKEFKTKLFPHKIPGLLDGKEWTEEEVEKECKNVIDQLLK